MLQELPEQISQCAGAAQVGIDLLKFLHNLPPPKDLVHLVVRNMLTHGVDVFRGIADALDGFSNKDYKTAGKAIGKIVNILVQQWLSLT